MSTRKAKEPTYQVKVTSASGRKVDLVELHAANSASARRMAKSQVREQRDISNLRFSARRRRSDV